MNIIVVRIVVITIVLAVTAIDGVVWFIWNLDLNDYRAQITTIIARQTGWHLELAGTIELHVMSHGFRLLVQNMRAIDPRGQFLDIARLQAQVSLDNILDRHIIIEDLEVAVHSCDVDLRPEVTPPLPITLTMDANKLHLTAQDCNLYDVASGLNTHILGLDLSVSTIPILLKGWLVMGVPAGIMGAVQHGTVRIASVAFGDLLGLRQLELAFANDHGRISIPHLTATLQPPNPKISSLVSPQIKFTGQIRLGFDKSPQALFSTLWKGVDDVWLTHMTLSSDDLGLQMPIGLVRIQNLRIESASIPLLIKGTSPLIWLTATPPGPLDTAAQLTISGSTLFYNHLAVANYAVNAALQPGRLRLALERGTLSTAFLGGSLIRALILNLNGEVSLVFNELHQTAPILNSDSVLPRQILLEHSKLAVQQVELATKDGNYQLANGQLEVQALPLLNNGVLMTPTFPEALLNLGLARPSVKLSIQNFNHKDAAIKSIAIDLAAYDNVLHLQKLEADLAKTWLTGSGELDLADPALPWTLWLNSPGIALAPIFTLLDTPFHIQGDAAIVCGFKSHGIQLDPLLSNLNGTMSITGKDLKVANVDLDAILTHLEDSRGVGFLDLGAYILLGPAGILLTKGTQYSVLLGSIIAPGSSQITLINSSLQIKSGVVSTEDVALATPKHRVAVVGTLDLRPQGPAALQIATVDAKGCAKYMETIGGTGRNPQVSDAGMVINSVLNPINSVLGKLVDPVIGGCFFPFYKGQVPSPY